MLDSWTSQLHADYGNKMGEHFIPQVLVQMRWSGNGEISSFRTGFVYILGAMGI